MPKGRPRTKTAIMTLRVAPEIKAAAQVAADNDRRSLTNLIEVLLVKHCKEHNLYPPEPMKEVRE